MGHRYPAKFPPTHQPLSKFIYLEEAKQFLNLEYVTLVTEQEGGRILAVNIIDQDKSQVVIDNDAHNLLAALKMEVMGKNRYRWSIDRRRSDRAPQTVAEA